MTRDLFDGDTSDQLKEDGMKLAADHNAGWLIVARSVARDIALNHPFRECHADAVALEMIRRGLPGNGGAAAGSLFRGPNWEFSGRRIRSMRITNHSREIKIWNYKGV